MQASSTSGQLSRNRLIAVLSVIGMVAALLPLFPQVARSESPGDVVINEIMQNPNAVGDSAGEWFELVNTTTADIDINGWTISDNDSDSHVIANGGPLLVPAGGYVVLGNNTDSGTNGGVTVDYNYGSNFFLANGGDELVLTDGSANEIDRVEWDGGPAFPDPTGASMSLDDPGNDNNVGGNWCTASTPYGAGDLGTPGAANDCPPPPEVGPGDVVINEIMQNPNAVGDSAGEWFELANTTTFDIDIDGWTISDNDSDSHVINNGGPLVIPAGGYVVLGNNSDSGTNGGVTVDYQYSSFFLANGGDELVLTKPDTTEIDRVEWDGGPAFPDPTGASMALDAPGSDNNVGASWCTASTPYGAGDLGTPGAVNDCVPPPDVGPGDVVINEIMQNPNAVFDSNGEWFELANTTTEDIDINGWTISDLGTNSHVINNGGPLLVPSGGFLILGNNADSSTNGGVTVDYEYPSSFALGNSDDELILTTGTATEVDSVAWDGGPAFPDPTGASMSLNDPGNDNNNGENWCTASTSYGDGDLGTPGAANDCPIIPPGGLCGDPETPIHVIQGSGSSSPEVGNPHVIEGIVTGDFEGSDGLGGFFVQEETDDFDADPNTSEGIFVSNGGAEQVSAGDTVRVSGIVEESFGLTRIGSVASVSICPATGTTGPVPAPTLPVADLSAWEAVEGMEVEFSQLLHASGNFTWARFGEVDLSVNGPLENPTNVVAPGTAANALQDLNNRSRIQLDDGSSVQNPLPFPPYLGPGNTLRTGDTVAGLTGVVSFGFGNYEIHPTEQVDFTRVNTRPTGVPDVGGRLTVAAYNVLNYFTTLDGDGSICGPLENQNCRGADTAEELAQQRAKLVSAIAQMDADVVGLMEIENHPTEVPTADLVSGLNDATAPGTYDFVSTGPLGSDAIRVALLYQPASVTPYGPFAVLDSSVDSRFNDDKNRAMLVQTFMENSTGELFTVAVNHLKSKGSPCDDVGDPNLGDGQGNCNGTRTLAAEAMVDFLASDPTGSGDTDVIIMGDLNAYAQEDPITAIEAGGYTDLIEAYVGTGYADGAYSFNFFSQSGYLDHGLTSSSLTSQVTGADFWHVNADEPSGLDYNNFNQPDLYNPDEFRASDHDPVIIGLDLDQTPPDVDADFKRIFSTRSFGIFKVDYSCEDIVDPDPECVGDINGVSVQDGQLVILLKGPGREWHRSKHGVLWMKANSFELTVTGTDEAGNSATETAEPEFRRPGRWW